MNQAEAISPVELEQAFEVFNRVSHQLDTTYRELEHKVADLTSELSSARTARLKELAEKERLAHRLSALISVLPGGVLIVDKHSVVKDVNPEAIQLLDEPLVGQAWQDILSRVAVAEHTDGSELPLKNGKRISIVSRRLDNSGDQVVLVTDVTQTHQLQEQLARKKRLAALGEMAARLAHQIRTPLSSATLYLSQLGRSDLSAEKRNRISAKVGERLGHMGNLLETMLCFVRGEKLVTEKILVNQVLSSFKASIKPQLTAAQSSIEIPYVDDSLMIAGDVDELSGALTNLVMNSLEAATGPVKLELWVGATSQNWMQIRYRDNGPGIDKKVLDQIFDPFFTTKAQGTGLGLAVVAMTVANHGGEISAANHPEGGAEFVITLPIFASELAVSEQAVIEKSVSERSCL